MLRLLAGCEPMRLNNRTLRIFTGSVADGAGTVYEITNPIDISLDTTGLGGRDPAYAISQNSDWWPIIVASDADNSLGAFITRGTGWGAITIPSGYHAVRKLPWGFVYKSSWPDGAGIAPFSLCGGWPRMQTYYSTFESGAPFTALSGYDSNDAWVDVDLSPWMPDNARLVYLHCSTTASGTAGSAYVRATASQATGQLVGAANPLSNLFDTNSNVPTAVTSARILQVKTTGGAKLTMSVMGYCQTEPS